MRVAFDACIVLQALRVGTGLLDKEIVGLQARAAVEAAQVLRMAAPAWLEVIRYSKPEEQTRLREFERKLYIDPVDLRTTEIAADLQRERAKRLSRATPSVCLRCAHAEGEVGCKECGRAVTTKHMIADFLVAAAAVQHATIETLYTTDGTIQKLAPYVRSTLRIVAPAGDSGELFAVVEGRKASR